MEVIAGYIFLTLVTFAVTLLVVGIFIWIIAILKEVYDIILEKLHLKEPQTDEQA
ncbi:MAG: hypothetical protein SFU91_09160 [Chloroherpetonaceae bacterium]|nr:hypothetical protein [Chloroherpetonaceae bacterium]